MRITLLEGAGVGRSGEAPRPCRLGSGSAAPGLCRPEGGSAGLAGGVLPGVPPVPQFAAFGSNRCWHEVHTCLLMAARPAGEQVGLSSLAELMMEQASGRDSRQARHAVFGRSQAWTQWQCRQPD